MQQCLIPGLICQMPVMKDYIQIDSNSYCLKRVCRRSTTLIHQQNLCLHFLFWVINQLKGRIEVIFLCNYKTRTKVLHVIYMGFKEML